MSFPLKFLSFSFFQVRGLVISVCSWWSWIEGFLVIKFYPSIAESFGIDSVIMFFALTCCFCGLFTIFFLPETKGRNLEEIAKSIGKSDGDNNNNDDKDVQGS